MALDLFLLYNIGVLGMPRQSHLEERDLMKRARLLTIAAFAVAGSASQAAIIFGFVNIQSPPLSTGSSFTTAGNSISFNTPNAVVGDASPTRSGILNIQYDACSTGAAAAIVTANVNLGTAVLGPQSQVVFLEQVFEIDALGGNEIGGAIGSISHNFTSSSSFNWSGFMTLSRQVNCIRVKKSLILAAPDTQAFDLAAVAINNQSIQLVPEPASLAALGFGLAMVLRRKSR